MFDRRLWQEGKNGRFPLILTITFSALGGVVTVLQAYWLSQIVAGVFLEGLELTAVRQALILLLAAIGARAGLAAGREWAADRLASDIKLSLRDRLFDRLRDLGPGYTQGEETGELTAVLTHALDALDAYFSQYLPQLFVAALIPLTILFVIFPLDWLSGITLLLTAPLIPLFMVLIGRYAEKLTQQQWGLLSRMSGHFLDVLQGLTTLKQLGQSKNQATNIAAISDRFRQTTLGVLRVAFLSALALELLATLSVAIIAVSLGLRLLYGYFTFELAFFILILAPEFYLPLRQLGQRFHAGMDGIAAAGRVFAILDEPRRHGERKSDGDSENRRAAAVNFSFANQPIRLENVTVRYAGREQAALEGVSLTIPPGKMTALVGLTGAGKSTLAGLLLRFVEPESGRVLLGDVDWSGVETAVIRQQIAWVPQQPYLFDDTIANNIRLGRMDAPMAEVIIAAQRASLHTFIQTLPQGYDTRVGERGARLSGGQAQRLALARAFLKNTPLLILDEPTAHLDQATEAEITAATEQLMADRTTLVIAHRLETIRRADQVVKLENGKLKTVNAEYGMMNAERGMMNAERQPATLHTSQFTIHNSQFSPAPIHHSSFSIYHSPFLRLLRFLAPYTKWVALAVLLGTLTVGSSVALLATSAHLIAAAALQPSIADLSLAIVGVRFFGLSRGILRYLERLVAHNTTFRLLAELRVWFYTAIEPLAPARLQSYRSGDLLSRIVADVETLQDFYVRVVGPPLVALLVAAGMMVFMAAFDPVLALALLVCLLLAGVGVPALAYGFGKRPSETAVSLRADLQTSLIDGLQGLPDLQAYGQDGTWAATIHQQGSGLARIEKRLAIVTGLQTGLLEFLTHGGAWLILLLAIPLAASGQINPVYLAALVLAATASFEAVQPLAPAAQHLEASLSAARRLFSLAAPDDDPIHLPHPTTHNSQFTIRHSQSPPTLAFRSVHFRYAPDDPPALQGVSFDLPPGKRLAIVGHSGAGKTSLINLLLRFWEWDEGEILLNGRSLRTYHPDTVRACFGIIPQQPYLFNASIGDNLRLANPRASQAEIIRAAQQAQIHEFIAGLPQGYETGVGALGMQLSGGERQRLAIARALLQDAPILLLDEPTANLDPATERAVLETIFQLAEGRSLLLITHRPAGLAAMDEVLRLDGGRVVG
jgi:ATP-binding cassette, subfamily C, bacterial CydCD